MIATPFLTSILGAHDGQVAGASPLESTFSHPGRWAGVRARIPQIGAATCGAALAAIWVASGATAEVRLTLTVFLVAMIAWIATPLDDTLVALTAAVAVIAAGGIAPERLFEGLGKSTVWLLIASFVMAAAATRTGLANRLTLALIRRARTVSGLFRLLSVALGATAFVVPATSGRAALAMPVFVSLAKALGDGRITKALALLFPTTILLSAAATLVGAGAHLVTAEVVARMVGTEIDYVRWFTLGGPFALVSCAVSTEIILRLFLDAERRNKSIAAGSFAEMTEARAWSTAERRVAAIVGTIVLLWATSGFHGLNIAILALVGAVAVTAPQVGAVSLADAIDEVPWSLVLFLSATLTLGESLVSSGAATWLADAAFGSLDRHIPAFVVVIVVALVSLGAHLLIGSRSARASVLTPLVVVVGVTTGVDPTALAFLSAVAAGYCLTLTVSAKPVALFAKADPDGYTAADLARLSAVLIPVHFVLLMLFALVIWPLFGLDLN